MRLIGILLVILGAFALGSDGVAYLTKQKLADAEPVTAERPQTAAIPPVIGGIAVVSGLIMIASSTRREFD